MLDVRIVDIKNGKEKKVELKDLTGNGRQDAIYQARELIERLEELDSKARR